MKWIMVLVAFIALGMAGITFDVFSIIPGSNNASHIEKTLQTHASLGLHSAGLDWAHVEMNGQSAVLGGKAPSDNARHKAIDTVLHSAGKGGLFFGGITRINAEQLQIAAPKKSFIWQAQKQPGHDWRLSGKLSSSDTKKAILALISNPATDSQYNLTDTLTIEAGVPSAWDKTAIKLTRSLTRLENGIAEMIDNNISLQGRTSDAKIKTELEKRFSNIPAPAIVSINIELVEPTTTEPKIDEALVCQRRLNQTMTKNTIRFAYSKADITPDSYAVLDQIAKIGKDCAAFKFQISGHSDNLGDATYNDWLSGLRAQAVRKYLIRKGVAENQLMARGVGSREPLCRKNTRSCRSQNRRIEINVQ